MATDYDAPRKTDEELAEDSLEELKARRAEKTASAVDVDEAELAENLELPGADLSSDNGKTWTAFTDPAGFFALHAAADGTVIAVGSNGRAARLAR